MENIRIDQISLASSASRLHVLPVMKDGATSIISVGQILDLLIDGAPASLNTLNEIAAALADDQNFASTVLAAIALKADATALALKLPLSGGVMTGPLDMGGFAVTNSGDAGRIGWVATKVPPQGWLKANGAAVSRASYSALFAALVTSAGYTSQSFTVTIAAPGVVAKAAHGLAGGERLRLSTNGALPSGLNTTSDFFVIYVDANTFRLAASAANAAAGTAIITTGTQSGTHSFLRSDWGLGDGATTFNLPDLRGENIRAWDDGRGVDTGRVLGSWQAEMVGPHIHPAKAAQTGFTSGNASLQYAAGDNNGNVSVPGGGATFGVQTNSGTENRVRTVALLACVKY